MLGYPLLYDLHTWQGNAALGSVHCQIGPYDCGPARQDRSCLLAAQTVYPVCTCINMYDTCWNASGLWEAPETTTII